MQADMIWERFFSCHTALKFLWCLPKHDHNSRKQMGPIVSAGVSPATAASHRPVSLWPQPAKQVQVLLQLPQQSFALEIRKFSKELHQFSPSLCVRNNGNTMVTAFPCKKEVIF